jgi:ankyrin repeat protein
LGIPKVLTIDDLVKAIEIGDEPTVRQGVAAFANTSLLDQQASNGETLLTQAVKATHQKNFLFTELLILNGASPDARNKADETPLFLAAERNDDLILNFLLGKRAKVDEQVGDRTALFIAIEKHATKARDGLLTNNPLPDVDLSATDGRTPLMEAASQGDLESATKLQQAKADLELKDSRKRTALMYASEKGYTKVVKFLLEKHANPHGQDDLGQTALMNAADAGSPDIGKSLLTGDRKVFVGVQDGKGRTALMHAVQLKGDKDPKKADQEKKSKLEFVKMLLNDRDTDLSLADNDQSTVLRLAARSGDADMVRAILQSPRAKGKIKIDEVVDAKTVLLEAAVDGRPPDVILAVLDGKPKNLDQKDQSGSTALMYCIRNVNAKAVRILVDRGAHVGQEDLKAAKDALQLASNDKDEKALKTEIIPLLERQLKKAPKGSTAPAPLTGAPSTTSQNTAAPTPPPAIVSPTLDKLIAAIKAGKVADVEQELKQLAPQLKAGKLSLDSVGSSGMTPLGQAAESNDQSIADLLLKNPDKKANIDAQDKDFRTALFVAAEKSNADMVDFLLDRGADPKIPAKKKVTPLMVASDKDIMDKLIAKGADVDAPDDENQTALLTKYKQGKDRQVDVLLPLTKLVNQKGGKFEQTILMEAVLKPDLDFVKKLVTDKRFDLNVHDKSGDTALTQAAALTYRDPKQYLDITKALLSSNQIDVKEVNGKKESALIIAAGNVNYDIVAALLAKDKTPAHLNLQDQDGNTALIASVRAWNGLKGDVRIVKDLSSAGADRTKRNSSGSSAEDIANNIKGQSSDPATQKDMEAVLKLLKP